MLILVRHGRTAANANGLLLGRLDPPLDEIGREQADAIAQSLGPSLGPDTRIVSSPLTRTRETAAAFGLPVDIDDRLVELDYGELDGRPTASVPAETWRRWRTDLDFSPPGGESLRALGIRTRAALDELATDARSRDVVVVSHVSPIKAAVVWALGVGDEIAWRLFVGQASISRVAVGDRGPVLQSFNDQAHLAGVGSGSGP